MWRDLIHSLRVIRRYPLSSIAIVLVLALGIGANTAMFSIFRTWITKPLDFPGPERLVAPYAVRPEQGQRRHGVSAPDADDWQRESSSLEGLAALRRRPGSDRPRSEARRPTAPDRRRDGAWLRIPRMG
jgi:putative ABC transport system permease protein